MGYLRMSPSASNIHQSNAFSKRDLQKIRRSIRGAKYVSTFLIYTYTYLKFPSFTLHEVDLRVALTNQHYLLFDPLGNTVSDSNVNLNIL